MVVESIGGLLCAHCARIKPTENRTFSQLSANGFMCRLPFIIEALCTLGRGRTKAGLRRLRRGLSVLAAIPAVAFSDEFEVNLKRTELATHQ